MKKTLLKMMMLSALALLASCGGGGSSSGSYGAYYSPHIVASQFVSALNSVDGTYTSYVELNVNETLRSRALGQDDWFVIWDAKYGEYKAVSLQYVRSLVYYDYYANNRAVAGEFRSIERDDIFSGNLDGDYYGDDYEVVDRTYSGYYEGRRSGYLYEDETGSHDVSLLAKEQEQLKFFEKASRVSFVYNVSLETSMSMLTLGAKIEQMLSRSSGELTEKDQEALATDLNKLTGVSLEELKNASEDSSARSEVLEKIAAKVGASAQSLEEKFLPAFLGVNL